VTGCSAGARRYLLSHTWPGNVRELENAIERAVVLGLADSIQPEDLPETLLEQAPAADEPPVKYYELVKEAKRQILLKAFKEAGSHTEVAKLLGLHPNNLHRLVRNLDLKSSLPKAAAQGRSAAQKEAGED
jgi:two-component system response regulator HydG